MTQTHTTKDETAWLRVEINIQTTYFCRAKRINGQTDGLLADWLGGWRDRWMDGWMDRWIGVYMFVPMLLALNLKVKRTWMVLWEDWESKDSSSNLR